MNIFSKINSGPIWIFVSNNPLDGDKRTLFSYELNRFLSTWTAHEQPVSAQFEILENQVVLVAADDSTMVTGCSKDKLHHFMQAVGGKLGIDFFNRMLVPVVTNEGIRINHWNVIEELVENGELKAANEYIDGTISRVEVFKSEGLKPLRSILVAS